MDDSNVGVMSVWTPLDDFLSIWLLLMINVAENVPIILINVVDAFILQLNITSNAFRH